jgi:hypothetical protein
VRTILAVMMALALAMPAQAKQRKIIEELPPEIVDNSYVADVEVVIEESAQEKLAKLEAEAAEKRESAGLPPYDPSAESEPPPPDQYPTLPFTVMAPLVIKDVTQEWGLTPDRGVPVNLRMRLESIKTANAGMALFLSSSDELSSLVEVFDPQTGEELGSFYVQVVNSHGGLFGLTMRGAGVREELVEEFALEASRILTGSKKKDWKKRIKAQRKAERDAAEAAEEAEEAKES